MGEDQRRYRLAGADQRPRRPSMPDYRIRGTHPGMCRIAGRIGPGQRRRVGALNAD